MSGGAESTAHHFTLASRNHQIFPPAFCAASIRAADSPVFWAFAQLVRGED
jgi:hypothetical protein